jgi:hypothetical protein
MALCISLRFLLVVFCYFHMGTLSMPPGAGAGKNGIGDLMQSIALMVPEQYRKFIPGYRPPPPKHNGSHTSNKSTPATIGVGGLADKFTSHNKRHHYNDCA